MVSSLPSRGWEVKGPRTTSDVLESGYDYNGLDLKLKSPHHIIAQIVIIASHP